MSLTENLSDFLSLLPAVNHSPNGRLQASYDEKADVLYVHFDRSVPATDNEITDDDIILRYDGERVVGITVLHASER
jgi:uncharacterized protein YuzE